MHKIKHSFLALIFCLACSSALAEEFIDLMPKTDAQVDLILDTLDAAVTEDAGEALPPIVMMLHGPQAHRFLRPNYQEHKATIDRTAKLAALGVLDVKICATWLKGNNYDKEDLFPFTNSVPLGSAELERLSDEEGYTEFSVSM